MPCKKSVCFRLLKYGTNVICKKFHSIGTWKLKFLAYLTKNMELIFTIKSFIVHATGLKVSTSAYHDTELISALKVL